MRAWIPILMLAGCLSLGACGGDDEAPATSETSPPVPTVDDPGEPGGGTEDGRQGGDPAAEADEIEAPAPEQVVELVLTTTNPEDACTPPNVTEAYVRVAYGSASGCAEALRQGGAIASSVTVEPVDDSGDTADAVALAEGGVYDGEQIELELVRSGDAWSVDRLEVDIPAGP